MSCTDCKYFDMPGLGLCGCEKSEHYRKERTDKDMEVCIEYERRRAEKKQNNALALAQNVDQLGRYLMQMGQLLGTMQRRLDEMEARQAAVTISHAEVKRLQGMIRSRADEICRKYELTDKESQKAFRAAIKKDLLKRYQVKDLHDLPAGALAGADKLVGEWSSIRLVMERRAGA